MTPQINLRVTLGMKYGIKLKSNSPYFPAMNISHVCHEANHMATTFEFIVSCPDNRQGAAEGVLCEAHLLVKSLEGELSEFVQTPIWHLNHSPAGEWVKLTSSGLELLQFSERLREQSQNTFDCTAKSLRVPHPRVECDVTLGVARRTYGEVTVSFGAIGKGYTLDRVRLLLEREGFYDYLLNAGGSSLIFSGFSTPELPWTWGWSWKKNLAGRDLGISFRHWSGMPIALGVSGLHEKGEHLIDPRTGNQSRKLASSLVGHPSATVADALSTALFVCGWEQGKAMLDRLEDRSAYAVIEAKEVPRWNGMFQRLWGSPTMVVSAFLCLGLFGRLGLGDEEMIDLGTTETFLPYIFERNSLWLFLPVLAIGLVILHLKKWREMRPKKKIGGWQ